MSETSNNRISVFEADGKFYRHISGKLNGPCGIAFDSSGNLHVSNYNIHSVKVFSPEGNVIKEYGSGIIQSPAGIAIDPEGYVFVSGFSGHNKLCIFNPQGVNIYNITQNLNNPGGIELDKDGYVYVSDYSNCRILN